MPKGIRKNVAPKQRPDLFGYHDYRAFLGDWIAYLKSESPGLSIRKLSQQAGLASGYLPMVLAGDRSLSEEALRKLRPLLKLDRAEESYLEWLRVLGSTHDPAQRTEALTHLQRFQKYKNKNPKEFETHEYLAHWYNVVIREMTMIPGFQPTAEWILGRLRTPVPTAEVERALEFLLKHGFLKRNDEGQVEKPEKILECVGGVYRMALSEFHRQMLKLTAESIERVPSEQRQIMGHTLAIAEGQLPKVREILQGALSQIENLGLSAANAIKKNDGTVYHVTLSAIPLTHPAAPSDADETNKKG